jgi:hypothetical protein
MTVTTKTFICKNFVSTDPTQNPDLNNLCSDCVFTLTVVEPDIVIHSTNHLIEYHGYQNNPQLENDIRAELV